MPFDTNSYGAGSRQKFDIYGTNLPKDAPIFVYIHGGYWQEVDKEDSAYCVGPLINSGCKVIILDYDLCPTVTLDQLVDQVNRAGEFILSYAHTMGSR